MENPVFSVNAIARQKNRFAFAIVDESIIKRYDEHGLDLINVVTANIGMDQFHLELDKAIAYGSLGGIKINYKTEVVTDNQAVIPGLYAAGTDANSIYDNDYVFILPGNSLGFAVNSGRIAGENAVSGIKK